jgi:hypothetical protein
MPEAIRKLLLYFRPIIINVLGKLAPEPCIKGRNDKHSKKQPPEEVGQL